MHFNEFDTILDTVADPALAYRARRDVYLKLLDLVWLRAIELDGAGHCYDVPERIENAFLVAQRMFLRDNNLEVLLNIAEWVFNKVTQDRGYELRSIVYPLFADRVMTFPFQDITKEVERYRTCLALGMMAKFCDGYNLVVAYEVALDPIDDLKLDEIDSAKIIADEKQCISDTLAELTSRHPWSSLTQVDYTKFADRALAET